MCYKLLQSAVMSEVPFYSCSNVKCWCFRCCSYNVHFSIYAKGACEPHFVYKCLQSQMKSCCFLTCTLIYCNATAAGSTSALMSLQLLKRCSASPKPVGKVQHLCNDPAVAQAQSCTLSS